MNMFGDSIMIWKTRRQSFDTTDGGILMGILNVTPDSFSDGGRFIDLGKAVDHALSMEKAGAMIIDIGGESTRPGSDSVDEDEEKERILPVIRAIRSCSDVVLSVDTRKPGVARAALDAGADIINDVEGGRIPGMAELCAEYGCGLVVMHMKGEPKTMQENPVYGDVVAEVRDFFEERYEALLSQGVQAEQICWDPGIGFGKSLDHNLALIAGLSELRVGGRPILLALSRKRMLGAILGDAGEGKKALPTAVMTVCGHERGAQIHRVHDVYECRIALALHHAVSSFDSVDD